MAIVTQKLRNIGGIINSTDLNYNFDRIQEDLQLAVEGVIFNDLYASVETMADRNAIPESALVTGFWVCVSENGRVYEWTNKHDVKFEGEKRYFGIEEGDVPAIPRETIGDDNSDIAFNVPYVCNCNDESSDWKYISTNANLTFQDGDYAVYIDEAGGKWIRVPKWICIMDVTSILENGLVGPLEDLSAELTARLEELGEKINIVNIIDEIWNEMGNIDNLTTTYKTNIVGAVNELDGEIGNLSTLTTTAKTNLVSSINEVDANVGPVENLTTTAKTSAVAAINELDAEHGNLGNLHTDHKTTFVGAINEVHDDLGTLSDLTTTAKNTAVAAINELDGEMGNLSSLTTKTKTTIVGALNDMGNISQLTTDTKTSTVAAINELDTRTGELTNLTTTSKTNLVSAINEVDGDVGNVSSLTTAAKSNTVAAINELDGEIGTLTNLTTTAKSNLVSAINEVDRDLGNLSSLSTTSKSSAVAAINELKSITDSLAGAYIYIGIINENTADVTQAKLTARALEIRGGSTVQVGWVLVDKEQNEWYYSDNNTWVDMEQKNIYHATNSTYGTVIGGGSNGDISISDGAMTVNHATNATNLDSHNSSYYAKSADLGTVSNLTTTSKIVVGAINELDGEVGTLSSLTTTTKNTLVAAINEVDGDLGALSSLTTTAKTNIVAAVNEINSGLSSKANSADVLTKTNTTAYTPTADYHPATKKYVDGIAHGAIWGNLTGTLADQTDLKNALDAKAATADVLTKTNMTAFTPSANYHPATKKYVDDSLSTLNSWGQITGTLSNQTDLKNALDAKQDLATAWNTTNLVVSATQPAVPSSGYIVWIDINS